MVEHGQHRSPAAISNRLVLEAADVELQYLCLREILSGLAIEALQALHAKINEMLDVVGVKSQAADHGNNGSDVNCAQLLERKMSSHGRREVVWEHLEIHRTRLRVDEVQEALHIEAGCGGKFFLATPAVKTQLVRQRVRLMHALDYVAETNSTHGKQHRLR